MRVRDAPAVIVALRENRSGVSQKVAPGGGVAHLGPHYDAPPGDGSQTVRPHPLGREDARPRSSASVRSPPPRDVTTRLSGRFTFTEASGRFTPTDFDEVGGDLVFSIEGEEEEGASADEAFGVGCIRGDLGDDVFDVWVQRVALIQVCKERFEAIEMRVDAMGRVSKEDAP